MLSWETRYPITDLSEVIFNVKLLQYPLAAVIYYCHLSPAERLNVSLS